MRAKECHNTESEFSRLCTSQDTELQLANLRLSLLSLARPLEAVKTSTERGKFTAVRKKSAAKG